MEELNGFIKHYLVSGPIFTDFIADKTDQNQIRYEQFLRSIVADRAKPAPSEDIRIGANSELGMPWEYYYPSTGFVNFNQFSVTPQKVELLAATGMVAAEDMELQATLWTYTAVDVWLEGERICTVSEPVYKPIRKQELLLTLKKGYNSLLIRMQNLAIRDTRNLFGIELSEHEGRVQSALPDADHAKPYLELDSWLSKIEMKENRLCFPEHPPCDVYLTYEQTNNQLERVDVTNQRDVEIRTDRSLAVVYGEIDHRILARKIELLLNKMPVYAQAQSMAEAEQAMYEKLAVIGAEETFIPLRFGLFHVLVRWNLGQRAIHDEAHINRAIEQIARREDCSDFFLAGLLRLMRSHTLPAELEAKAEQAILDYRYWMTEEGADGMCFWSENHALMFYIDAYMAGNHYPDKLFPRSGRMGLEVSKVAKGRIIQWLEDVEEYGFEEFLSADYMCVTLGALLNVVDYMDKEESDRAAKLIDQMLESFAWHTFRGSIIAPQARIYRSVILPFTQSAQSIIHLLNPSAPVGISEWMAFLMNSNYKLPSDYAKLMNDPLETEYQTGNAWVKLTKQHDYMLTSVQSPRYDVKRLYWENNSFDVLADVESNLYIKSFNERYHGTSKFEPGVHGYQQHMWYAAVDNDTVVFTNHPGELADDGGMRPGYWYGNGIMPAIKQQGSLLGAIYDIGDEHPAAFTHLFFPTGKFDTVEYEGGWMFGQKEDGFVAIWSSGPLVPHHDLLMDCEFRVYGTTSAYVCQCGSKAEFADLKLFKQFCQALSPVFHDTELTLTTANGYRLSSSRHENKSQYI